MYSEHALRLLAGMDPDLAVSRTKTDPRIAFRDLLKEYPNIRRDAYNMFGQWAKMVDRAARASRPARTLE